jgi:hypothetical protein
MYFQQRYLARVTIRIPVPRRSAMSSFYKLSTIALAVAMKRLITSIFR